jgi:hypothetical protein
VLDNVMALEYPSLRTRRCSALFSFSLSLPMVDEPSVLRVFESCAAARRANKLISLVSASDKEFHFQNWFRDRLTETGLHHEAGGRNSYPDFRMVASTDGYEVKGLKYPGREASFDCNSQVPTGLHNGRTVYYVFGRYPEKPDGLRYPVLDFVLVAGSFLNARHEYVHKNKSVRGFGSYGDILIRDRKMYVAPTPFGVLDGVAHTATLILPASAVLPERFVHVGDFTRRETATLVIGYEFDLQKNTLTARTMPNPDAGREHHFRAWRLKGDPTDLVGLRVAVAPVEEDEEAE